MTFQQLRGFLLALAATGLSTCATAQNFELYGQWHTMKWSPGSWSGKHALPEAYCLTFPAADTAIELGHGFHNRGGVESLSVHRLFARGSNRFEIATLQLAPEGANEGTEAAMAERLTGLADRIVQSLQECTASLPVRVPQ